MRFRFIFPRIPWANLQFQANPQFIILWRSPWKNRGSIWEMRVNAKSGAKKEVVWIDGYNREGVFGRSGGFPVELFLKD